MQIEGTGADGPVREPFDLNGPITNVLRHVAEHTQVYEHGQLPAWLEAVVERMQTVERDTLTECLAALHPKGLSWEPGFVDALIPELTGAWYHRKGAGTQQLLAVFGEFRKSEGCYAQFCKRNRQFLCTHHAPFLTAPPTPHLLYERGFALTGLMYLLLRAFRVSVLNRPPKSSRMVGTLHHCGRLLGGVSLFCIACGQAWCSKDCQKEEWSRHRQLHNTFCSVVVKS